MKKKAQVPKKKSKKAPRDPGLERATEIADLSLEYAKRFAKKHKLDLEDDDLVGLAQYLLELRDTYAPSRAEPRDRSSG